MEKVRLIEYTCYQWIIINVIKITFKNIIYTTYNDKINLLPDITIHKREVEILIKCEWYTCEVNMDCMLYHRFTLGGSQRHNLKAPEKEVQGINTLTDNEVPLQIHRWRIPRTKTWTSGFGQKWQGNISIVAVL